MTRQRIIAVALIVVIVIGAIFAITLFQRSERNIASYADQEVATTIRNTLESSNSSYKTEKITLLQKKYYLDTWLIVKAQLDNEPSVNEARVMIYVFDSNDQSLRLLAYSADGFSTNSFPSSTPEALIEEANRS